MSAPLTILIPTLNAAEVIGPTLSRLVEGAADGLIREVIIADGGSNDEIALIADEAGATLITAEPGRGNQLKAGAEVARGAWLLVLHADTQLRGDWIREIRDHLERHPKRAGYFRLRFDSERLAARWIAGWANVRSKLFALPYGDQGLLISKALYDEIGGYDAIPLMEDVRIIRKLGRRHLRALKADAVTSAARYERDGFFWRGLRNWRCLAMYFVGISPAKIAEIYRSKECA